jgi:cyclic-di-GMP-binding protein
LGYILDDSIRSLAVIGRRLANFNDKQTGYFKDQEHGTMASFDIVSRIELQEVDNAVNITKKAILSRYDFRESKTEIALDKKEKKMRITTEDEMRLKAVQDTLIENLVKRKVDVKCLDAKEIQMASQGMVQREIAFKEGVDADTARTIVKMIKDKKLKVQAAIQENQVRVTGKKIDDLQTVIQMVKGASLPIPLQFVNMTR